MRFVLALLVWFLRAIAKSHPDLVLENLALRQQLAAYARGRKHPQLEPHDRKFRVALSRAWTGWRTPLLIVQPATVIAWHRRGFQRYWRWRSGKPGRPRIDAEHIAFIRRISGDHPGWGEDKIAAEVALKLGVRHSASTIRRYMVTRRKPSDGQTWRTFLRTVVLFSPGDADGVFAEHGGPPGYRISNSLAERVAMSNGFWMKPLHPRSRIFCAWPSRL
jgi:hypothetical protein